MTITDPMHNLYLGTAKRILKKVWIEQNLISTKQFEVIQARVDSVCVPGKFGRIPSKIASSFSGFTADQHSKTGPTSIHCLPYAISYQLRILSVGDTSMS